VAIPADIDTLRRSDAELARAWRTNVRTALEAALAVGYTAVDLVRGPAISRYVLLRGLAR
jgi:predicted GNAT superfamily acetyltransferase